VEKVGRYNSTRERLRSFLRGEKRKGRERKSRVGGGEPVSAIRQMVVVPRGFPQLEWDSDIGIPL